MRLAESQIGVLGKIPAHGDFVRLNAGEDAALAFFDWVQGCLERLQRDGLSLENRGASFFFPVESAGEVLVGSLVGAVILTRAGIVLP